MKRTLTAIAAVAMFAGAAAAQVTPDDDSLTINLSGEVDSVCELAPSGSTNYDVDMLNTGNQGLLIIAYTCNSPYEVTLTSANGGMQHSIDGSLNIDYDVETRFGFWPAGTYNSDIDLSGGAVIASETNWGNIVDNLGSQNGNIDLQFDPSEYAVAGEYADTLTITLQAQF